jgi:hypothetical protein
MRPHKNTMVNMGKNSMDYMGIIYGIGIIWALYGHYMFQINRNFRILKWRYVSTIFLAIFCREIP